MVDNLKMGSRKDFYWFPYTSEIKKITRKGRYKITYKGGEEIIELSRTHSLLFYGTSNAINMDFAEDCVKFGVPIVFHRRNIVKPIIISGGFRNDRDDTITFQLSARNNERKKRHISRKLLEAKFKSQRWLVDTPPILNKDQSIDEMRIVEAHHANLYWRRFYRSLDMAHETRRGKNELSTVLDAYSKFLAGVVLRWVTFHHLSPHHGFLHVQTDYPSLVYDLMEPYRGIYDRLVFEHWRYLKGKDEQMRMGHAFGILKDHLRDDVYVGLTRQISARQELYHGSVISLKHYLLKKQRTFAIPLPSKPNGGRPTKVSFIMYGRKAGRTDFWKVANGLQDKSV
jgi:CRISPR-associated endonuclease Cas1